MVETPNDTAIECNDELLQICQQLYDATLEPRFQILVTQGFVERMVNAVINTRCKNGKKITGNHRDFPYSSKLLILNELGLLDDGLFRRLNQLRGYRNDAAHDPFFSISGIIKRNGARRRLHEYCIQVICEFYNLHREILAPIVAPQTTAISGVIVFRTNYRVDEA